ncbi:hypothetical protein D5125_12930 [Magnetovirga frankeli]|uniref:Mor transcription activator family protein n=1 Tax=Magnetovirga frankeli TaxID=947516 RepID=UPI0012940C10|nr:hypothetical protein D5125_12930 [gamma proteobacterium SS-5]
MSDPANLIDEVIGRDAYLSLVEWSGGISLYVPATLDNSAGRELIQQLGQEAAEKLSAWAGGSSIAVPAELWRLRRKRQRDILAMRRRGMTVQEISRKFTYQARYTERQIYRLLSDAENAS